METQQDICWMNEPAEQIHWTSMGLQLSGKESVAQLVWMEIRDGLEWAGRWEHTAQEGSSFMLWAAAPRTEAKARGRASFMVGIEEYGVWGMEM